MFNGQHTLAALLMIVTVTWGAGRAVHTMSAPTLLPSATATASVQNLWLCKMEANAIAQMSTAPHLSTRRWMIESAISADLESHVQVWMGLIPRTGAEDTGAMPSTAFSARQSSNVLVELGQGLGMVSVLSLTCHLAVVALLLRHSGTNSTYRFKFC